MFDLKVIELKELLIKDINNSGVPLVVIDYVLGEIKDTVKATLASELIKQKEEKDKLDAEVVDINY